MISKLSDYFKIHEEGHFSDALQNIFDDAYDEEDYYNHSVFIEGKQDQISEAIRLFNEGIEKILD